MRRLLLALPLCIPVCAYAQQAANPVEPFSYGVHAGTSKNPIVAVLSSVVPSARAGSTQAAAPVELFSYGRRIGTTSNPLSIYCPSCGGSGGGSYTLPPATAVTLGGVKIGDGITAAADGTISVSFAGYLPTTGGTMAGPIQFSPNGINSETLFDLKSSFGDELLVQTVLGRNAANSIVFSGVNHSPHIQLSQLGTTIDALTINGNMLVFPSPTEFSTLNGSGNGFACLDTNGVLYRSATACN